MRVVTVNTSLVKRGAARWCIWQPHVAEVLRGVTLPFLCSLPYLRGATADRTDDRRGTHTAHTLVSEIVTLAREWCDFGAAHRYPPRVTPKPSLLAFAIFSDAGERK